jgi:lipoprotein-anchoring transpeptidase ErfK/SrfK
MSVGQGRRSVVRGVGAAVAALLTLALALVGGWLVVDSRAAGGGASIAPATVPPLPSPSGGPTASPQPQQQWTVARALGPVTVYRRPAGGAAVRATLPTRTRYGVDTVLLVRRVVQKGGDVWYEAWLPVPPNGSRGWVLAEGLATYQTSSEIVIDRQKRSLRVIRDGVIVASFTCAVGASDVPTPAGFFFVMEKVRPTQKNGPYGALAIGISAFQPKLATWPGQGQVAIHGTNDPSLIGEAVSHGCVRLTDHDVLAVARLVPVGSPVIIR